MRICLAQKLGTRIPEFGTRPGTRFCHQILDAKHKLSTVWAKVAARAPCDVFDPWVRREWGQIGIRKFVQQRHLEIWEPENLEIWEFGIQMT